MKNKIKIPKSFKLIDDTYKIKFKDDLHFKEEANGFIKFESCKIYIQPDNKSVKRSNNKTQKSFYHELVHAILYKMGESELNDNEKFVDLFATLLHQYEKTKKYDDKK